MVEKAGSNSEDYDAFQLSTPEATRLKKVFEQLCALRCKYFNQTTNEFEHIKTKSPKKKL